LGLHNAEHLVQGVAEPEIWREAQCIIRLLLLITSLGLTACGEEESSFPEEQPAGQRDSGYSGPTLRLDMLQVGSADASLTFIDTNTHRGATDATTFPPEVDGGTSADSGAPIIDAFVDPMPDAGPAVPGPQDIFPMGAANVVAQFELNGNVVDASGNGRDLVLLGGQFQETAFGQGLGLSNEDHGLDFSAYANQIRHPYTIEFVFTPDAASPIYAKLFSPNDDSEDGWYLREEGFRPYPIEGGVSGPETMPFGQRAYLAVVSTAVHEVRVYVNGVQVSDDVVNAQFEAPPANAVFFFVMIARRVATKTFTAS
jgi:hypothetical protein